MTINLNDLHDPLVQVFAGENIDMDRFNRLFGPDARGRAENVAFDPYAAAKYFNFAVNTILSKLLALRPARAE